MMTAHANLVNELAHAADGLAATAAYSGLKRVHDLCLGEPKRACLHEAMALGVLTARIESGLTAGRQAMIGNDAPGASRQWTRALLLMDRLARFATAGTLPRLAVHQKSGRVG
ncbi:MAG: hypothetical protein ACREDW_10140 [Aestuariivirgaceae bacterium]